ncbi:MAG: O-antigen ligase family protein [candidate division Zixibacteria bacterium]|nr:O-antigen ligase family protein [candidate division Zixibacteria bacterium]
MAVKKKKLYWPRFNWLFLGYIGIIGLTVFSAANNRMVYEVFHMMSVFFVIFLISSNVSTSMKQIKMMVWLLLITHLYLAFEGISGGGRANNSLMGDENDFALALNTMIPFTYFMFEYAKTKLQKYVSMTMLIVFSLGVVSSMSRGGWVGFMAVLLFLIFQSKRKMVSLASVAVIGVAIIAFAPSKYWDEIQTISDTSESTARTRLNYWKAAGRMFLDYPIVGVGANNGGIRMPQYVTGFRNSGTQWGRTFHGTLPQVLAELGGLGMIAFLGMLFYAISKLRKIRLLSEDNGDTDYKMLANSILGGFVGYMVSATFLSTLYYPQIWTLYTLTIMLMFHIRTEKIKKKPLRSRSKISTAPAEVD